MPDEVSTTGRATVAASVDDRERRINRLAGSVQLPDGHVRGVVVRLDDGGNVTASAFVNAALVDDGDTDDQSGLFENVSVSVDVEVPATLRNALEKLLSDNNDSLDREARRAVARHMLAAGV